MKKFIVTGKPLILKSGSIQLTKEQAASRGYCLKVLDPKKGLYLVTGEACFKVGETIGYDGPDYKRLMNAGLVDMDEYTKTQEEKAARAKEKAEVAQGIKVKLAEEKAKAEGKAKTEEKAKTEIKQ